MMYGYKLSTETISNMTNKVLELAKDWQNRALEQMYPILFMDTTVLKIRIDRVVKNVADYIMLGIIAERKK